MYLVSKEERKDNYLSNGSTFKNGSVIDPAMTLGRRGIQGSGIIIIFCELVSLVYQAFTEFPFMVILHVRNGHVNETFVFFILHVISVIAPSGNTASEKERNRGLVIVLRE